MGTYAQISDCQSYIPATLIPAGTDLESLIAQAEKDVDSLFLGRNIVDSTGRRWDVADTGIPASSIQGLKDATCAQVEYRLLMGEIFFRKSQYEEIKGPDFTTKGKLPRVGPKAIEELVTSGCIPSMTKAIP